MVTTLAINNNKGGVGKTDLTVQTAAGLARAGKDVLVVDMDPQANATRRLGIEWDPANPIATMSEVLLSDQKGAGQGALVACGWLGKDGEPTSEAGRIDVLPSRFDLIRRETEAGVVGANRRLKKALDGWTSQYDYVLIDTLPGLGHLVQMALAAADHVIIATDPNYDSVEGAIRVSDFVDEHASDLANAKLKVGGVVVTRRKTTDEHSFQLQGLTERFGDLVWNLSGTSKSLGVITPKYIPEWSRFSEAAAAGVSLSAYTGGRSNETIAIYDSVAAQIMKRFPENGE